MLRRLALVAVLLAACSDPTGSSATGPGADPPVASGPPGTSSTTVAGTTTTTGATPEGPLEECDPIPYAVGTLPARVDADRPAPDEIPRDQYTTIPGTRSDLWFDDDGEVAVSFIRGSLPPEEWPGDRGEVSIDGARGVAGPFEDGSWVVAWFEGDGGERCDRYFMVFYPPVEPSEVEATVASLDRTAG
jgi:hypothetical protein